MALSFLPTLFSLLMLLSGGASVDLLSAMTPEQFWAARGRTPTVQELVATVAPPEMKGDVKQLVSDLSSPEFKTRAAAAKALEGMGPDVIPQLKGATESTDAEVAGTARGIVLKLSRNAEAREVDQLMAIRALGEHKEAAALPALKEAAKSKDPFVAEYALRAVGQIEGHPVAAVDHRAELEKDVWLLPRDTGTVLQEVSAHWAGTIDIAGVAEKSVVAPGVPALAKEELTKRLTSAVLMVADRVGAVRIDGMTVGISKEIGPDTGWVVVMARGPYNRAAVVAALKELMGPNAVEMKAGDAVVLSIGEETRVAFLEGRVILVQSATKGGGPELLAGILKAVESGTATLKENAALAALIQKADRSGPLWGASVLPELVRKEAMFAAYEQVTLSSKEKEGSLQFSLSATGPDGAKVKESGTQVETELAHGVTAMKQSLAQAPAQLGDALKGEVDLIESLKVTSEGTHTTLTGEVGPSMLESMKSLLSIYASMMPEPGAVAVPAER